MAQWFHDLTEEDQRLVQHGWGSEEFADWSASFLLSIGGMALKSRLNAVERNRLNLLLNQRSIAQHRPGHQPDLVEHLYHQLHDHVASLVRGIDDHTGKHGRDAVHWLDAKASSLQNTLHDLYDRLTGN